MPKDGLRRLPELGPGKEKAPARTGAEEYVLRGVTRRQRGRSSPLAAVPESVQPSDMCEWAAGGQLTLH